jgi:hypothetical protein
MKNFSKSNTPGGSHGPSRGMKQWFRLLFGVALIIFFMYIMGPLEAVFPGMSSMSSFIERRNLKATALYYTDIEEFGEATASLKDNLRYSPEVSAADRGKIRAFGVHSHRLH